MKIRFTHPVPRRIGAREYPADEKVVDFHPAFAWRLIRRGVAEPVEEADIEIWQRERPPASDPAPEAPEADAPAV